MSSKVSLTLLIGSLDRAICLGLFLRHPGKQRWTRIEANSRVVVYDLFNGIPAIESAGHTIRCVALGGNTFVPIMKWIRRILLFHILKPGIFTWRLVKVAVNTNVAFH